MKVSLVITTKDEERSIGRLLDSVANQSTPPDEVLIADAGSSDKTHVIVSNYAKKLHIKLFKLPANANRAVGRNHAIEQACNEHILITDAGCELDPHWIEEMIKGFKEADVVAGFYAGKPETRFEEAVIPYALVMPEKLDKKNFLPATRSMGITKNAFEKLGKFNENFRYAEDYEFARRMQTNHIKIFVAKNAIVYWRPRSSLTSFARMIYEHAYGDGYSRTFRPKVGFIFIRYTMWIALLPLFSLSVIFVYLFSLSWKLYLVYAIKKNFRYAPHWQSIFYLPLLQVVSDFAVMKGTMLGMIKRIQLEERGNQG